MDPHLRGVPPPDLTLMVPVVFQAYSGYLRSQDQQIGQYARDVLSSAGVVPIPPLQGPSEGHLGTPERGTDEPEEAIDSAPVKEGERERFIPLIPRQVSEGPVTGLQGIPIKTEFKFKEIVLKAAEKILPDNGAEPGKGSAVDRIAEVVESEGSRVLSAQTETNGGEIGFSAKMLSPHAIHEVHQQDLGKVTELHSHSLSHHAKAHGDMDQSAMQQTAMVTPDSGIGSAFINAPGQQNVMVLANALYIPIQTSLSREGVQAVASVDTDRQNSILLQNGLKEEPELSTLATPSSTDVQGLTLALTLPLGLFPITPAQVIAESEHLKVAKEEMSGIMHRSLQHEHGHIHGQLPSALDTLPTGIPVDRPNLFPIPDGREITFILQMAQMGEFRGKKVEDSQFRMSDGLELDPGYRFGDLLSIVYLAALCGASSMTQIGAFVEEHEKWLARHFDLKRGAPAPLIFMWLFSRISPYYFTKMILQQIRAIVDRERGRRSPLNAIRMWETNAGVIFGQSKKENKAPSQEQMLRIFDWEEATLILEPAADPEEVRKNVSCRMLMSVEAEKKEKLLQGQTVVTRKQEEWNEAYDVKAQLELTLYPHWTLGHYMRTQEGVLKVNRSYLSNLPLDFAAWDTLFYSRSDVEEQTHWSGEGRFLNFGDLAISHAMENMELLVTIAYKAVLAATTVSGTVEQKRKKLWDDPDELMILIGY